MIAGLRGIVLEVAPDALLVDVHGVVYRVGTSSSTLNVVGGMGSEVYLHTRLIVREEGLRGLEETRRVDLEQWMEAEGLDAVVFPAVADVGPADADVDEESAAAAWRNGVWVANGNLVPRHLGIPTVTVPMGTMADTGMPVGLTIAGAAWTDTDLLRLAAAVEATRPRRTPPPRTPPVG